MNNDEFCRSVMDEPMLIAYVYCATRYPGDAMAVVWCAHCRRWHWHIVSAMEHGETLHPALCNFESDSPYLDTGYRLVARPMSDAIRADVTRPSRE